MPSDSSLITFRVSADDHDLLRAVAAYSGETLSSFVRLSALASARQLLAEVGPEAVVEGVRTHEVKRHTEVQQRLAERLEYMRTQSAPSSSARDRKA